MLSTRKNIPSLLGHLEHISFIILLVFGFSIAGCGGGGSTHSDGGSSSAGEGTLSVALSDITTDEYKGVYVTISRVDVQPGSETTWKTVADTPTTCNLLELVNGEHLALGETSLKEGIYPQVRVVLGTEPAPGNNILNEPHPYPHYTIASGTDETRELRVPEALLNGINVISAFAISENEGTDLVIDFDASRSIIHTKDSQNLLKPVLKTFEPLANAGISGVVGDKATPSREVEGCYISVQEELGSVDDDELIAPVGGTLSNPDGKYSLLLEPGDSYTLVAFKQGYQTQCFNITDLQADETSSLNFRLEKLPTAPGSISGEVRVAGSDADQRYATIQVHRVLECQNDTGTTSSRSVIVRSIKVADQNIYTMILPPGVYKVVAFAPEETSVAPLTHQINLHAGGSLIQHFRLE
jgi:hypothetical protein